MIPSTHLSSSCASPALQSSPMELGAGSCLLHCLCPRRQQPVAGYGTHPAPLAPSMHPMVVGACTGMMKPKSCSVDGRVTFSDLVAHHLSYPTGPSAESHCLMSLPVGGNVPRQQCTAGKRKGLRLPPRSCSQCRVETDPVTLPRQQPPS